MTIVEPAISNAPLGVAPLPIRVHTGPQRRGRKLSDAARYHIGQAVMTIQKSKREGLPVSVREAAEKFNVPKSTLHRYLRNAHSATRTATIRPQKLRIPFLVHSDVKRENMDFCSDIYESTPLPQEEMETFQ